ncbi:MAG: hypothetical protein EOP21_08940 [Hyphomicrobiales bacterium]|nr:MAG: hypothetical protein EOP21_08940 [Hyphomicrobiales bacterium]
MPAAKIEKAAPEARECELPQDSGFAVGPSLDRAEPRDPTASLIQASCQFGAMQKRQRNQRAVVLLMDVMAIKRA